MCTSCLSLLAEFQEDLIKLIANQNCENTEFHHRSTSRHFNNPIDTKLGHAVRKAQGNAGGGQAGTKTTVTFVSNPLESAPDDIESGAGSREASASPPPQPDSRADLALMPKGKLLPYCGAVCLPCLGLPAIAELLKMGALLRSVQRSPLCAH